VSSAENLPIKEEEPVLVAGAIVEERAIVEGEEEPVFGAIVKGEEELVFVAGARVEEEPVPEAGTRS
jgi:hypothetical protein